MSRSDLPPRLLHPLTHFVVRVHGKAAGFTATRREGDELATILNSVPGCPPVTVHELQGPMPSDWDAALRFLNGRGPRIEPRSESVDEPTAGRPRLRLIRGGR